MTMRSARRATLLLIALSLLSGCATTLATGARFGEPGSHADPTADKRLLYPATTLDVLGFGLFCCTNFIEMEGERSLLDHVYSRTVFPLACLIDLPFSLVSDTLLLPFDLHARLSDERQDAAPPGKAPEHGGPTAALAEETATLTPSNPPIQGR